MSTEEKALDYRDTALEFARYLIQVATPCTAAHDDAADFLFNETGEKCPCGYCQFPEAKP